MAYTKNKDRIAAELNRLFREAKTDSIEITMKADGRKLGLQACYENVAVQDSLDFATFDVRAADFVLVIGKGVAIVMSGHPNDVIDRLANYEDIKADYEKAVTECREYFNAHRHLPTDSQEFRNYSDAHKDLFDYRPIGWEFDPLGNLG